MQRAVHETDQTVYKHATVAVAGQTSDMFYKFVEEMFSSYKE